MGKVKNRILNKKISFLLWASLYGICVSSPFVLQAETILGIYHPGIPVKYVYEQTPFFVWQPHRCLNCGGTYEVAYGSKVIDSQSEEAKDYDFFFGNVYVEGEVEFKLAYLHCPECGRSISLDKMWSYKYGY